MSQCTYAYQRKHKFFISRKKKLLYRYGWSRSVNGDWISPELSVFSAREINRKSYEDIKRILKTLKQNKGVVNIVQ